MTKTIVLTDLVVTGIVLDYDVQCVVVDYKMVDSEGNRFTIGKAYFWVVIPDPGTDPFGNPVPIPDNWFQLPASYFPTLLGLRDDADTALTAKFLV